MDIDRILEQMVKFGASDLHMQESFKPALRIDGALRRLDVEVSSHEDMATAIKKVLTEKQHVRFMTDPMAEVVHKILTESG
ncbi:hypothetical protein ACFL39_02215 [Gemmatimonadota bacterium]